MWADSSFKTMYDIVNSSKAGTILTPDDFATSISSDAIRSGLGRLCRSGKLCRLAQGIYYVPLIDKWDGTPREPSLDAVAQKIAKRDNARIVPTGDYALNKLGLSTQVPANIVYITDGSARKLKFKDGRSITFRHSNDMKNFAYQSQLMQLAVAAMRELGQETISEIQVSKIRDIIMNGVSKEDFAHDIVLAPIWIKNLLQR